MPILKKPFKALGVSFLGIINVLTIMLMRFTKVRQVASVRGDYPSPTEDLSYQVLWSVYDLHITVLCRNLEKSFSGSGTNKETTKKGSEVL